MNTILGSFGRQATPIGRLAGIPITLDRSWFIIAVFVVFGLSGWFAAAGFGSILSLFGAALCAAGFFGSIVAHEMGHALTARRYGIQTESISLHVLGGVARILREARTPGQEFTIAAAGPAVSLGLGAVFAGLAWLLPATGGALGAVSLSFWYLGQVNILLGLFNLLPGFPLDGGRILRALVWHKKGSRRAGTLAAARIGQGLGVVLMVLGGLSLVSGNLANGLLLGMVGFMIRQSAQAEAHANSLGAAPPRDASFAGFTARPAASPRSRQQVVRLPDGRTVIVED
jgi:Zn-dependent protease